MLRSVIFTLKEWLSNELEEWLSNNFGLLTLFLFRQNRNKIVIHKITSLLESSNAYMKVRVIYLTQYHNTLPLTLELAYCLLLTKAFPKIIMFPKNFKFCTPIDKFISN